MSTEPMMRSGSATLATVPPGAETRLRNLNPAEFEDRYDADRFTISILSSRFEFIMEHLSGLVLRGAFSAVIREFYDFSGAISAPPSLDFATLAVAKSLPTFFGSLEHAVRTSLQEFGVERLQPGDVLVCNDPYRAGTHVNDVCFIRPVFYDGRIIKRRHDPCAHLGSRGHRAGRVLSVTAEQIRDRAHRAADAALPR